MFATSVNLIRNLKYMGIYVAVVTSSKNCEAVLLATGILNLFDARVDGNVAMERGLAGKPAPDTYEEAARMLEVPPELIVIVEDAVSGVLAAKTEGFGLIIGVARAADPVPTSWSTTSWISPWFGDRIRASRRILMEGEMR